MNLGIDLVAQRGEGRFDPRENSSNNRFYCMSFYVFLYQGNNESVLASGVFSQFLSGVINQLLSEKIEPNGC